MLARQRSSGTIANDAIAANEAVGSQIELAKITAVQIACLDSTDDSTDLFEAGMSFVRQSGYRAGEVFLLVAACSHACRIPDPTEARRLLNRLNGLTEELKAYGFWYEICHFWLDDQAGLRTENAEWLLPHSEWQTSWRSALGSQQ
jgi:hypothetical protein